MSFLTRLLGRRTDDCAQVRPLWHRIVELARDKEWYAHCGIVDSVPGRFDAITLVMALVLLRMEREPGLIAPAARLTELFVDDMDGQLRQNGIGDLVVGKHMGRLMSVLGGRIGAYRDSLPQGETAVAQAVTRNVTLAEGADPALAARKAIALAAALAAVSGDDVLAARI